MPTCWAWASASAHTSRCAAAGWLHALCRQCGVLTGRRCGDSGTVERSHCRRPSPPPVAVGHRQPEAGHGRLAGQCVDGSLHRGAHHRVSVWPLGWVSGSRSRHPNRPLVGAPRLIRHLASRSLCFSHGGTCTALGGCRTPALTALHPFSPSRSFAFKYLLQRTISNGMFIAATYIGWSQVR